MKISVREDFVMENNLSGGLQTLLHTFNMFLINDFIKEPGVLHTLMKAINFKISEDVNAGNWLFSRKSRRLWSTTKSLFSDELLGGKFFDMVKIFNGLHELLRSRSSWEILKSITGAAAARRVIIDAKHENNSPHNSGPKSRRVRHVTLFGRNKGSWLPITNDFGVCVCTPNDQIITIINHRKTPG